MGSDRASVLAAIQRAATHAKAPMRLAWETESLSVLGVALDSNPASARADVFLAVTEDGLSSAVKRGENEGRRLRHAAVVRRLVRIGQADAGGAFQKSMRLDLDPVWNRRTSHIVTFAQARNAGPVTAAGVMAVQ